MFCSTFLQALEKYESNPEDVGEAFQEWVSKNEKKKKISIIKILPPKFFVFFLFFVFKFFVFLYFLLYLSHKMNKMCQLYINLEDILIVMVSAANQNRAFSLSIVLVFNKIASPYQLEKIKSLSFISLF